MTSPPQLVVFMYSSMQSVKFQQCFKILISVLPISSINLYLLREAISKQIHKIMYNRVIMYNALRNNSYPYISLSTGLWCCPQNKLPKNFFLENMDIVFWNLSVKCYYMLIIVCVSLCFISSAKFLLINRLKPVLLSKYVRPFRLYIIVFLSMVKVYLQDSCPFRLLTFRLLWFCG